MTGSEYWQKALEIICNEMPMAIWETLYVTLIATALAIAIGLPLGVLLHAFVMDQIRVDLVSFKYTIAPVSYLLTVVLVLLFSLITDRILRRKIAKIDMAESLKSNE